MSHSEIVFKKLFLIKVLQRIVYIITYFFLEILAHDSISLIRAGTKLFFRFQKGRIDFNLRLQV